MTTAVLLSGGMDSVSLSYLCRPEVAITIDYGQLPAAGEVRAAAVVAETLGIPHEVVTVDLKTVGSGDLAGQAPLEMAPASEWWPFRNQMLITIAAMKGISLGVAKLLLGTVKGDGFHADARRAFVAAMDETLRLQEGGLRVEAPAIEWTAAELVRRSGVPREVLAWAHSCHVAEFACGTCRGCNKHFSTWEALGAPRY